MKIVYAGSFDPITNGHMWMIDKGHKIVDDFIVAIGVNPDKKYMFTVDERIDMIWKATRDKRPQNIEILSFENKMLVDFAKEQGAQYLLRGIRSETDYEYERSMSHINGDINEEITTLCLLPPDKLGVVSSSMVKGLIGLNQWEKRVKNYVPGVVLGKLKEKVK